MRHKALDDLSRSNKHSLQKRGKEDDSKMRETDHGVSVMMSRDTVQ